MRRKLVAVLVLGSVIGAALPAAAGDHSNALLSVGPANQSVFQVGDEVSVPYEVDPGEDELEEVSLTYADPYGGYTYIYTWSDGEEPLPSELSDTVTSGWRPGAYELQSVGVHFVDSAGIYFDRDGSITDYTDDSTGTHDIDISAADFTVVNDDADVTAPVLDSFEVASEGVRNFNDQVNISYEAHDASGLGYVFFVFRDPEGHEHWAFDSTGWDPETDTEIPMDGIATGEVDIAWASGRAELVMVGLGDNSEDYSIWSFYEPDGRTYADPSGFDPPPAHDFDFAGATVEVDNAEYDVDAPVLSAISRVSSDHAYPGEKLEIAYVADDPHFESIDVHYRGPEDGPNLWASSWGAPSAGQFESPLWDLYVPGDYALDVVGVRDSGIGVAWFERDGTVATYEGGDDYVYGSHNFDLAALDFTIEPWPHAFEDVGGGRTLFLAPAAGKVRADLGGTPFVQEGVEFTPTGASGWAVRYADVDFSIVGTFDTATGDFAAVVRRGNNAQVLTNDPR